MSQTTSSPGPTPPPTFDFQTYQSYAHQVQEGFVIVGLLGGLYGVLAILTLMAGYTLLTRQSGRAQPTSIVLCLTVLALFTSTTVYIVISIIYYQSVSLNIAVLSGTSLWPYSSAIEFSNLPKELLQDNIATARLQACAAPATLTVNVVLGDAIVCWRACVVWHRNSLVKAIVGTFLLATFALGVVDTAQSCQPPRSLDSSGNFTPERPTVGIAACVLSLSTNLLATFLVAYKAWESRMRVKQFLVVGPNSTRMQRVLVLLIESGALYSTLWLLIVAFQIREYVHFNEGSEFSTSEAGGESESKPFNDYVVGKPRRFRPAKLLQKLRSSVHGVLCILS